MYKLICLLAIFVFVLGCSKGPEGIKDLKVSEEGYEVKLEKEGVTVSAGDLAKLPKNFPSDVYIYKNAKLVSSAEVPNGFAINLETSDSQNAIFDKYEKEMANNGWKLQNTMNAGAQKIAMFSKGNRMSTLALDKSENGTLISVTSIKQ